MVATIPYLGLLQREPNKTRGADPLLPSDIRKFTSQTSLFLNIQLLNLMFWAEWPTTL
jgi:hypothetical protein